MSEYTQGKYPVILFVIHCFWADTWECSCSKQFCILLVVVSSTSLLKGGSVRLHRFYSLCSHLHLCNHSVSSCGAAAMHLRALKLPGINMTLSNGEVELKSLFLSLLFVCVWAFAALSSLERERSKKRNYK